MAREATCGDGSANQRSVDWIRPAGALWAVWAKGRKELNENDARDALDAALVDVKIARFSAAHGALKPVVPKAKR